MRLAVAALVLSSGLASARVGLEREWLFVGSPDSTAAEAKPAAEKTLAQEEKPFPEEKSFAGNPEPLGDSKDLPALTHPQHRGDRLLSRRPIYLTVAALAGIVALVAGSQATEDLERTREVEESCIRLWGYCPDPPETHTESYVETRTNGRMVTASLIGWGTSIGFLIAGLNAKVAVAPPPARTEGTTGDFPDFKVTVSRGF